jgi:2-C-methyl-D-erythritol 2,4-cyclodiphosphate synthase
VVLLERIAEPGDLETMSAVMESQRQLEDVVRDLVSQVHGVPVKAPFDTEDIT